MGDFQANPNGLRSRPNTHTRSTSAWSFDTTLSVSTDASPSSSILTCLTSIGDRIPSRSSLTTWRQGVSARHLVSALLVTAILAVAFVPIPSMLKPHHPGTPWRSAYKAIRPLLPPSDTPRPDPMRWLEENSNNKYAVASISSAKSLAMGKYQRPRAVIISLVRNSELKGILQSMRQLEWQWNRKFQYDWMFFNDEPFSDEFRGATQNLTSARCSYQLIPKEHWSLPAWIDESRFENGLEYLGTIGVGKGWMISYHHMCRWNSGFFYKHPALQDYDYYWRVEPDVHYYCDIDYDVFRFMRDNRLKYGFNMNILDDARSFPSLWPRTEAFRLAHPHLVHPEADLAWLLDGSNGNEYNNCQFFSNFEIGDLNSWRAAGHEAYFRWLDDAGGFYYERYGDAPFHTLSAALFLAKRELWFFRDVGYQHGITHHCPPHRSDACACQPTPLDANFYKLVPLESPQRKPDDTCLRLFLGAEWLAKQPGWTQDAERLLGGDGYHGYEVLGDE